MLCISCCGWRNLLSTLRYRGAGNLLAFLTSETESCRQRSDTIKYSLAQTHKPRLPPKSVLFEHPGNAVCSIREENSNDNKKGKYCLVLIQLRKLQRDFFVYKWYYKKHLSHSTNKLLIASQIKYCGFQLALSFMSSKGFYAKLNRDAVV